MKFKNLFYYIFLTKIKKLTLVLIRLIKLYLHYVIMLIIIIK